MHGLDKYNGLERKEKKEKREPFQSKQRRNKRSKQKATTFIGRGFTPHLLIFDYNDITRLY